MSKECEFCGHSYLDKGTCYCVEFNRIIELLEKLVENTTPVSAEVMMHLFENP